MMPSLDVVKQNIPTRKDKDEKAPESNWIAAQAITQQHRGYPDQYSELP